jgi:hypothetical protein
MRTTMSRGLIAALVATMLAVPATAGAAAPSPARAPAAPPGDEPATPEDWARMGLEPEARQAPTDAVLAGQAPPVGANPYTSLLPDPGAVDWAYWQEVARARGEARAAQQAAAATTPPLPLGQRDRSRRLPGPRGHQRHHRRRSARERGLG